MKKLLLTANVVLLACTFLPAQKAKLGLTAGATISNYHLIVDGGSISGTAVAVITAGLLTDVPLRADFSFQPALNLTGKGTKNEQTDIGGTETLTLHSYHAELLLNFLYNHTTNAGKFFIGAGPSVSMGVFGKWKDVIAGDTQKENVKFGNTDNDDLRPLDIGANVTTGFCFPNGLFIAANFNHGLNNLAPGGSANGKLKSHYFGLRLGFFLKNGK